MEEIWKEIPDWPGYSVSNLWRVQWKVILKPRETEKGYLKVQLHRWRKIKKNVRIHRLVAGAFLPNPDDRKTVNHKDWVKTNNIVTNLEWNTYKENIQHSIEVLWNKSFWHYNDKRVNQFTKWWVFIKTWNSVYEASLSLWIRYAPLINCLRKKKHFNTAWWFKWEYADIHTE